MPKGTLSTKCLSAYCLQLSLIYWACCILEGNAILCQAMKHILLFMYAPNKPKAIPPERNIVELTGSKGRIAC